MAQVIGLIFILIATVGFTQQTGLESWNVSAKLNPIAIEDASTLNADIIWTEQKDARTIFSNSFVGNHGQTKQIFSSVPIHYMGPDNELLPYELSFTDNDSNIVFEKQEYPIQVDRDGGFQFLFNEEQAIKIGTRTAINDNVVTKHNNSLGVFSLFDFENLPIAQQIEIDHGKLGFHYRIFEPLNLIGSDLELKEQIELPEDWNITQYENQWHISDKLGKTRAILTNLFCYDQNNNSIALEFEITKNQLVIRIPNLWLSAPGRTFPVTIDPLLAGVPSVWSGGQMPSCFMPAYNEDSIQVTIPAGVTPTGVYVDASFYANPFTFATMAQGAMYFSSSCGSSQSFTVTGATANLAGTAYLDSFNLMNPLTCCLQKSCNPIQFWVSMHLGRNANGPGCNTSYILYDPLTTSWPFRVVVYGRSAESYGNEWYTSQTPICSNKCQVNATAYARYGVPPYTVSHPWTSTVGTIGQNMGCNTGASNFVFTLDIPNCPVYCDSSYTSLSIPPPVIVDACGTYVTGIQAAIKPLIPAIEPNLIFDSILCNGMQTQIYNPPCISGGVTQFITPSTQGFGDLTLDIINNTDSILNTSYLFFAEKDGCISDTIVANVYIVPNPSAAISINPNPVVVGNSASISNSSTSPVSSTFSISWSSIDSIWVQDSIFTSQFDAPGSYTYCLRIIDEFGCLDSVCEVLNIVPASIENINVVTPNDDQINDVLYFNYLDFYPNSSIQILNRWGQLIYSSEDYKNDWNGSLYTEGTYFYILKIPGLNKTLQSFFVLKK